MKRKSIITFILTGLILGTSIPALNMNKETKTPPTTIQNTVLLANQSSGHWIQKNNIWNYIEHNKMQTGWVDSNGTWYFLNDSGAMQTGWIKSNETWYFLNDSGAMQTGWIKSNGTWYFSNDSGAMQTGWIKSNGTWYFSNDSGAMQTGWIKSNGTWYFLNDSGAMQTGWIKSNGTWYFLNDSGAMQTGWIKSNGSWYYLNNSGAMQTGTQIINGTSYNFGTSGALETSHDKYQAIQHIKEFGYLGGRINNDKVFVYGGKYLTTPAANEIKTKMIFQDDLNKLYDITIKQEGNKLDFKIYNLNGTIKDSFETSIEYTKNQYGETCLYHTPWDYSNDLNTTYLQATNIKFKSDDLFNNNEGLYVGKLPNGQDFKILIAAGTQITYSPNDYSSYNNQSNNIILGVIGNQTGKTTLGILQYNSIINFFGETSALPSVSNIKISKDGNSFTASTRYGTIDFIKEL